MNSAPVTGTVAHVTVQPPGQQPIPANPPLINPPVPPLLRNMPAPKDPRGIKRGREEENFYSKELSSEPSVKQIRTDITDEFKYPSKDILFKAIENHSQVAVKQFLKKNAICLDTCFAEKKFSGLTPLCLAAFLNNKELINIFVRNKADINTCSLNGSTPLMFAAQGNCIDAIELLIKKGADLNAVNFQRPVINASSEPFTALDFAISKNHLSACKVLLQSGADIKKLIHFGDPNNQKSRTPLLFAIESGFEELIEHMILFRHISLDDIEPSTRLNLVDAAASVGSYSMLRFFMRRGVNTDVSYIDNNSRTRPGGIWRAACASGRGNIVEALLAEGMHPLSRNQNMDVFVEKIGCYPLVDIILHVQLLVGAAGSEPDGLKDDLFRKNPHCILELMARNDPLLNNAADHRMTAEYLSKGLSAAFLQVVQERYSKDMQVALELLCGKQFDSSSSNYRTISTYAQRLQTLIEQASVVCGDPGLPLLFEDKKLTSQSERMIRQMLMLQRDLVLEGIAYLREQFAQNVARLPDLCLTTYISRSNRLNEADLYRLLTEDYGLYDPIARAALRLVKDASSKFLQLKPEHTPEQFSSRSEGQQLKMIIAETLEEWDKVTEILDSLRASESADQMDIVADLLFQQWRMFNEALGVTKERALFIGPLKREKTEETETMTADPS